LIGGSQVSELLGELSAVGYTSKYNNLSLIKRVRKDYKGEFTVGDISISKLCGSGSSQMIFWPISGTIVGQNFNMEPHVGFPFSKVLFT
jgi:hypothetical protein